MHMPVAGGTLRPADFDPTVPSPTEIAQIQTALGISLHDTDPAIIQHVVDRSRVAGNEAFRQKRYKEAVRLYSQAIAGDANDAALFGNRSAAYLALGLYEQACWDARKAVALRPGWPKGHYRLGCAHLALSHWGEAAAALARALELEAGSSEVAAKLATATQRAEAEEAARWAQAATERRGITAKLRAARRADQQLAMLNQFKQSMVGPDWELDDLEWRPTFLPAMRLKPLRPDAELADSRKRLLAGYLAALADLAHPKHALGTLEDVPRLQAYQRGIASTLAQQPPNTHVLVLGSGGGLLALLAAEAGAGSVTAVERSRMLYRLAKQVLESNRGSSSRGAGEQVKGNCDDGVAGRRQAAERVRLLDRRLQAVGVRGEAPPPDVLLAQQQAAAVAAAVGSMTVAGADAGQSQHRQPGNEAQHAAATSTSSSGMAAGPGGGEEEDSQAAAAMLPARASILVTDLLDHSVLGMGLLPAVDYAAERLLAPGALVVPQRVQVHGMLLELRVGQVSGFDLSALNCYWWHPGAGERLDLARLPHRRLSAPFRVHCLDLQARVRARQATSFTGSGGSSSAGNDSSSSNGRGRSNASSSSSSANDGSSSNVDDQPSSSALWELDMCLEVPVTADGQWNAIVFWFEVHADDSSSTVVSSWAEAGPTPSDCSSVIDIDHGSAGPAPPAAARSWAPAVQYVDSQTVARGSLVTLRVRQDSGQFVFTSHPPQCRPRHALVPRWHFDMVLDQQRNDAYDAAIQRAVQSRRDAGCDHLLALDLGAGSGLLSMMAARAGADEVYATEMSAHMCDVGEEACISNGFLGRIAMMDKDARRLDVLRKPDGTPPDLPRRADLLVYEVFDSGCIGEGVLHILAAAQARLLAPGAAMVPISARVFCQPIQMRLHHVLGWDCSQANRWRWRPDYEGLELGKCRERWVALGEPVEVFSFNFQEVTAHMAPSEAELDLHFSADGVFNAVAMWFELQLDEEATLSTSPYSDKGLTWQQAVQWVPEVEVRVGQRLALTARHDTYSISYSHKLPTHPAARLPVDGSAKQGGKIEAGGAGGRPRRTDVPLVDPAWQAAYERLQGLNSQLVKACVQNPLEYRAVAQAALQFATRPHDLGVDAQQAAEFCVKLMG